jgi:DNA-binding LacI/PurR family transcriptional regulator
VSFALNDRPGLASETRDRILAAAQDLGWRPSARARALSRSRAFALGLVIRRPPQLLGADPFFPQFMAGVETALAEQDSALVLQVVADDDAAEARSYRRMASEGRVDGVFLLDMRTNDSRFPLLVELGLPAVAVGRPAGPRSTVAGGTADGCRLAGGDRVRLADLAGDRWIQGVRRLVRAGRPGRAVRRPGR